VKTAAEAIANSKKLNWNFTGDRWFDARSCLDIE
jgi:hypothetical protein